MAEDLNETVNQLTVLLNTHVESGSFENHISLYYEMSLEFVFHTFLFLSIGIAEAK